jgi:multisubunit Na+/H+ antiporter MnhB subunit
VLLNFRSYDTLLEIAVLLIVAVAMVPDRRHLSEPHLPAASIAVGQDPMLTDLVRWLVPIAVLVTGSLLWSGAYAPGGAFQAGAVLASAGIAIVLAQNYAMQWQSQRARGSIVIGLLVFVAVAIACVAITGTLLQFPVAHAGSYILFVELALTLSIAATLLLLFTCLAATALTTDTAVTANTGPVERSVTKGSP